MGTGASSIASAIVGSRRAGDYGKRIAARFAQELVEAGITVVSGLARGVVVVEAAVRSGALGTAAICTKQELLLVIIGGVFVMETVSVMLQVGYFKWTKGKRIFRMAPLHHHFELSGWKETQVVVRFWIISMMLVLVGLSTLKLSRNIVTRTYRKRGSKVC